uniref:FxsB family radical SAM/SPASM domain protein n=1 Tax=Streptomyces sp. NBC_00049 TaxID=2903617 RepID=A0AAU2JWF0_9ACTN
MRSSKRTSDPGPWLPAGADLDGLVRRGWRPLPFTQFVLKVHGRCNLDCDYCYVYRSADQSWRTRPAAMTEDVITTAVRRIAEHAARHALPSVHLVLHGGEPLLSGRAMIAHLAQEADRRIAPVARVAIGVQSNGLLIDEAFLELFHRWDIKVGISLDGIPADHDRHRVHRQGTGSHRRLTEKLSLLTRPAHRHLFSGLLCTVDLRNDPVETYEHLVGYGPPAVDFLLPHGNWTTPPPGRTPSPTETPYADWLLTVFDHWYDSPERRTGIRLFEDVITLLLGGAARSESVGLSPCRLLVIETDGSMELVDSLKSAYPGAARLGLDVRGHPLDRALAHDGVVARQIGAAALSDACRACPVHRVCGGGHVAHRYRAGTGFLNPSVYCADLRKIVEHVHARLRSDLGGAVPGPLP